MSNRMLGRSWRSIAPLTVTAAAVLGLGVWPAYQSFNDANTRRSTAQAELEELHRRHTVLTPIAESGDQLEAQLIALDDLVPSEHDIAGFIVELDDIADGLGIELRDVIPAQAGTQTVRDAGTPQGWSSVALNVRIISSYVDLIDFVEATTGTNRLAVIDSLTVATAGEGALDATIALRLFRNDSLTDGLIARYAETAAKESQP